MTTPSANADRRRIAQVTFVTGCVISSIMLIHSLISGGIIASLSLFNLVFFFLLLIVIFMIGALIAMALEASSLELQCAQAA